MALRAYTRTLSVRPTESFVWCASFETLSGTAYWRIIRVTGISEGVGLAPIGEIPTGGGPFKVTLSATGTGPWNREEIGYGWPENRFTIPKSWPSGLYAAQFKPAATSWEEATDVYFVLRPPAAGPKRSILLCYPLATTIAYAGGVHGVYQNIYDSFEHGRSRRVSLDRPLDQFAFAEDKRSRTVRLPFLFWQFISRLPGHPAVDVCTSFDLHNDAKVLAGYQLFVSVGHDEYWSWEMRDRVESFVAGGGNAAFFSANTCWWQVRFERSGRVMVCHKSGIEDPITGSDDRLVTANWASAPTRRPENTLTGVSFRNGTQNAPAGTEYRVVAPKHPLMSGVAGTTFGPPGLLEYETDGADYTVAKGEYRVTGRDGTPLNFQILATADVSSAPRSNPRGRPTMGVFTNRGTVFTAGTTEWADHLSDSDIAQITKNVINALSMPTPGAGWDLLPRVSPPPHWEMLEHVGAAEAIWAVFQGRLLMQRGGSVLSRDAEAPSSPWESTPIPAVPDVSATGTDLYSVNLFAGSKDALRVRTGVLSAADGWEPTTMSPPAGAQCVGIAAVWQDYTYWFGAFRSPSGMFLYLSDAGGKSWKKLGPMARDTTALTACDSKLFAVQGGRLYCRENSPLDLTWTRIGDAPENTFCLAAYFGRLYALAGSPSRATLHWRAATAEPSTPFRPPCLLFAKGSKIDVGPIPGSGAFDTTAESSLGAPYTHVTRANDGKVFFYDQPSASGVVCTIASPGVLSALRTYPPLSFSSWSHVVYTIASSGEERVLFYDRGRGQGTVGHFDTSGGFVEQWTDGFSAWTHVTTKTDGSLFFYDTTSGEAAWGNVSGAGVFATDGSGNVGKGWGAVVPAGSTYLFFYRSDGHGQLAEVAGAYHLLRSWSDFEPGWMVAPAANGLILLYDPATGRGVTGGFNGSDFVALRRFPERAFALGWAHIASIGVLRIGAA